MAGGASVDGRRTVRVTLGHVQHPVHLTHRRHKALRVVVLVRAQRDTRIPAERTDKSDDRLPFRRALALLEQQGVRTSLRLMGAARALLGVKISREFAASAARWAFLVLRPIALE